MGKRHRARECAVQCLYQWEVTGAEIGGILSGFWEATDIDEAAVTEFTEELVRGTVGRAEKLDDIIAQQTRHWRMDRVGLVEKSILRLGAYELVCDHDMPAAVVIDEAVELAKRFSGPEAGPFVNGILDGINRRVRGGPSGAEKAEAAELDGQDAAAPDV